MSKDLGIGVGAGLVSALLFGVLLKATPLAIVLYLLAPLPILIVGLGWSHRAALAAVAAGALALAAVVGPFMGLGYATSLALPACWLAYLALLGRPDSDGAIEWYPTGRLLAWVAGTAALVFAATAMIAAPDYETFRDQLARTSQRIVQVQIQGAQTQGAPVPAQPSEGTDAKPGPTDQAAELHAELSSALATVAPALATQGLAILLTFYLWAAARIVQISGRLPRPWPDLAATVMPRSVLIVLAVAALLSMLSGYAGMFGVALLGAFSAAFALQGLAAFHDRSRGRPGRVGLLIGLYLVLFLSKGIALFALTLFGVADTAMGRRARPGAAGG